jgi:hypothetical protein
MNLSAGRADARIVPKQVNDLGSRQEDWPIPVRRVHVRRPSEIKRIVHTSPVPMQVPSTWPIEFTFVVTPSQTRNTTGP